MLPWCLLFRRARCPGHHIPSVLSWIFSVQLHIGYDCGHHACCWRSMAAPELQRAGAPLPRTRQLQTPTPRAGGPASSSDDGRLLQSPCLTNYALSCVCAGWAAAYHSWPAGFMPGQAGPQGRKLPRAIAMPCLKACRLPHAIAMPGHKVASCLVPSPCQATRLAGCHAMSCHDVHASAHCCTAAAHSCTAAACVACSAPPCRVSLPQPKKTVHSPKHHRIDRIHTKLCLHSALGRVAARLPPANLCRLTLAPAQLPSAHQLPRPAADSRAPHRVLTAQGLLISCRVQQYNTQQPPDRRSQHP
jgi:hypothetical protein